MFRAVDENHSSLFFILDINKCCDLNFYLKESKDQACKLFEIAS